MTNKLSIVEQREVIFYGDELLAVQADDGRVYVAVRQMCHALGLDSPSQVRRIKRHDILAEGLEGGVNLTYPSGDQGGGPQKANVLRVDLVPLWLSGVRLSATKEEIRPKLERYQREAAAVLWEAFQEGRLTSDPTFAELLQQDTPEVAAYKMIQGMLQIARNQILIRSELDDHDRRLEALESTIGDPGRHVTPDQASQISQAVKAVAHAMGGQGKHYQSVYGEMYRKFGITSYKLLPAAEFDHCMTWLTEWYATVTGGEGPF